MLQNVTECFQVVIWKRFPELLGSSLRLAGDATSKPSFSINSQKRVLDLALGQ